LSTLGIDTNVIDQCVDDTYVGGNPEKDDNKVYKQFAQEWRDYGHNLYPSMVINGKIFRGRLTPDNAFESICSSFEELP
jgi:hypothetical protein